MEYKDNLTSQLMKFEHLVISQKVVLRFFVILTVILAVLAGLGWERFADLTKKYEILQAKHDRLNRIYLQERQSNR